MARRPRRTPEQVRNGLERDWQTMKDSGNCYGGFGICRTGCSPELKYLRGRSYENKKCFECFTTP